jgi:hypothetical protein
MDGHQRGSDLANAKLFLEGFDLIYLLFYQQGKSLQKFPCVLDFGEDLFARHLIGSAGV